MLKQKHANLPQPQPQPKQKLLRLPRHAKLPKLRPMLLLKHEQPLTPKLRKPLKPEALLMLKPMLLLKHETLLMHKLTLLPTP